jgi:hypothetical protein
MDVFDLSALLARVFDSWEAWRDEALVLKAAIESKQDAETIKTVVKATKTLPRLNVGGSQGMEGSMELDFGLELDQRLKLLGSAIEDLLQMGDLADESMSVKVEGKETDQKLNAAVDRAVLERINLLQRALTELNEVAVGGLMELQLCYGFHLEGLEAIIGSFSSLEVKGQQAGGTLLSILEDLDEKVEALKSVDRPQRVVDCVFNSVEMTTQNDGVKEAFRAVMLRIVGLEKVVYAANSIRADHGVNGRGGGSAGSGRVDWLNQNDTDSTAEDNKQMEEAMRELMNRVTVLEQGATFGQ